MNIKTYMFVGEGPEADALIARVRARKEDTDARRLALCEEHGADGLLMDWWDAARPIALYYLEKQDRPYLKNETRQDGRWCYYPKRSTKMGKALKAALDSDDVYFSASSMILQDLSLQVLTSTYRSVLKSNAGCTDTQVVVILPVDMDDLASMAVKSRVPSWFREVTQSELDRIADEYAARTNQ